MIFYSSFYCGIIVIPQSDSCLSSFRVDVCSQIWSVSHYQIGNLIHKTPLASGEAIAISESAAAHSRTLRGFRKLLAALSQFYLQPCNQLTFKVIRLPWTAPLPCISLYTLLGEQIFHRRRRSKSRLKLETNLPGNEQRYELNLELATYQN